MSNQINCGLMLTNELVIEYHRVSTVKGGTVFLCVSFFDEERGAKWKSFLKYLDS
jgi:hypothetical protein